MKLGITILVFAAAASADVVLTSTYSAEGGNNATTVYAGAARQRFDTGDTRIIRQCDLKRIVHVDDKNKTYTVIPLSAAPPPTPAERPEEACTDRRPATDTGERKLMLGLLASRWKTVATGCADGSTTELDGWYVGLNYPAACEAAAPAPGAPPGFPIQYTLTSTDKQGKASTISYAIADLQLTAGALEAALFEVPAGFTEISLEKANALRNPDFLAAAAGDKPQGVTRVGVATAGALGAVDSTLVKMLANAKVEAVPIGAGPDADIEARASDAKVDYILTAQVTEIKEGGGSRLGGALSKASTLAGSAPRQAYTATVAYKLAPRGGGAPRLSASTSGSTSQFGLKEAMALGRMATMFTPMGMMMRSQTGGLLPFFSRLMGSGVLGGNTVGMGMMGSADPNVSVMQTTMMAGIPPGGPFGGENQEAAVSSALDKVAKAVASSLRAPAPKPAPAKSKSKKK